jgi:2'-hydroxyisoflavone reductase
MGVFNALGPDRALPFREVVETARAAAASSQEVVWVAEDFLEKEGVQPWSDLPMWIPAKGEYAGFGTMSNQKAVAAGLRFRPIADTARDTHAWVTSLPADAPAKKRSSGISRDREAAVIAKWKAR